MTGFGRATGRSDDWSVEVECKSVNRDRFDVRVHLPGELSSLEPVVRERVKSQVGRGKVDVYIDFEFLPGAEAESGQLFDPDRFNAVVGELQELSKRTATGPVNLANIVEFRDLFEREQPFEVDEDDEVLLSAIDEAVDELLESRTEEGSGLADDLQGYLDEFAEELASYQQRAPDEIDQLRERIETRVREALEEFDGTEPEQHRLAEEIVYHTDRADVSEELQRAESHVESVRELIVESPVEEPVGKEIDFYFQELQREANTLSSKSATSELTDLAVAMKSLVEKMREQAANIE
jgi:uncharacterized protein (TIGR00255 family)